VRIVVVLFIVVMTCLMVASLVDAILRGGWAWFVADLVITAAAIAAVTHNVRSNR
jgi:hypothetical protein